MLHFCKYTVLCYAKANKKKNCRLRLSFYGNTAYDFIYGTLLLPSYLFMTHFFFLCNLCLCTSAFLNTTGVNENTMAWSITRFIFICFCVLSCLKFECKLRSVKTKKVLFFKCPSSVQIICFGRIFAFACFRKIQQFASHSQVTSIVDCVFIENVLSILHKPNHHQFYAAFLHVGFINYVQISIANICCLH